MTMMMGNSVAVKGSIACSDVVYHCGTVSLGTNEDISDDDDGDGEFRRYDRKQNTRDADDLRQSLRQRLLTTP